MFKWFWTIFSLGAPESAAFSCLICYNTGIFIPSFWLLEFKTLVETWHLLVLVKTPYNSSSPVSHQTKNENTFKFLISVVFSCNMAGNLLLQIKCVYFPQVKSSTLNNDLNVFSEWIISCYNLPLKILCCVFMTNDYTKIYTNKRNYVTQPPYLSSVISRHARLPRTETGCHVKNKPLYLAYFRNSLKRNLKQLTFFLERDSSIRNFTFH